MDDFEFRSIEKLLKDISAPMASANGTLFEKARAELMAKCSYEISSTITILNQSIKENTESSGKLGTKVFWLNIILTFATAAGAVATVAIAYSR